jgi:hypothetical protein
MATLRCKKIIRHEFGSFGGRTDYQVPDGRFADDLEMVTAIFP